MRYSVVLPRAEAGDADETKAALKAAADLWARGEQREALREVRRAAWGCSKAGNDVRALALSKAAKAIQASLDASIPPEEDVVPSGQPSTRRDTPQARVSVKDPRSVPEPSREARPSRRPKPSRRPPGRQSSPNNKAVSKRPPPPPADTRPALPRAAEQSEPASRSRPQPSSLGVPVLTDSEVELDLVVTVAPGAWKDTEAATLVGHRAARVAVAPIAGKKGSFVIRVLGPGEVAPANTAIALLVALEAGSRKLSRAG